jgi:hypothetical protein
LPLLSKRFEVMPRGFAIVAGMRETMPGMLKMVPGRSPAMFRSDFSTPPRLRVMLRQLKVMSGGLFSRPGQPFSSPPRPILRPGRLKVMADGPLGSRPHGRLTG